MAENQWASLGLFHQHRATATGASQGDVVKLSPAMGKGFNVDCEADKTLVGLFQGQGLPKDKHTKIPAS